ncbi:hypothetical protein FRC04_010904 [Tulasnella sp. 424]|nr:hypothetical protein FRC04_010904 [Tulasnella sp. 424]KAG8975735.1 hypothetical protein FRC05_005253 [Tulasnella sp. 425]
MRRRGSSSATLRPRPSSTRMPVYEVPTELWLKIFSSARHQERHETPSPQDGPSTSQNLKRNNIVKSLTLTCRHFSKLCRPILFERIVLNGQDQSGECINFLKDDAQARSWVRLLKVRNWIREPGQPEASKPDGVGNRSRQAFPDMEELFIQFPSLKEVHFLSSDLTEAMLQHLAYNLCVREGGGTPDSPTRFDSGDEQLPIVSRLHLDTSTLLRSLPLFQSTDVSFPAIETIAVSHTVGVAKIPPQDWMISLQGLVERAPNVDELKLPSWTSDLKDEFEPLASLIRIPNLRTFQGPLSMAQIAMGLDLESLYVQEAGPRGGSLVPFSYFTSSLRSLCISNVAWRSSTPRDIAKAFPQLEILVVYAPRYWTAHTYTSDMDPLPKLRTMVLLDGSYADTMGVGDRGSAYTCSVLMVPADRIYKRRRDVEDKLVQDLEKVCPELQEVRLHPRRMWERGPSGWQPVTLNYSAPVPMDSIVMEYV